MGTGGTRYGAGRPGWRWRCENKLRLDIRHIARKGCLRVGSFDWQWRKDGEPAGTISMRIPEGECLATLSYTRTLDGAAENISDAFKIQYTPCNYGGQRPWFVCKWCQRRCAVLYGISSDGHFGCRQCLRLGYTSESESVIDRAWRKQYKLEARLGRKGMHRRTAERLCNQIDECEERRDIAMAPALGRLLSRLDPDFAAVLHRELNSSR